MLPFRVIQIEQHRALQQSATGLLPPHPFRLAAPPPGRDFSKPNCQIPDLVSGRAFTSISSRNTVCLMQKHEGALAQWAPTSNRKWTKNRCHRKQRTKPCLTGARTHIKVSLNSTRIAQKSELGNYISNRFWDKNRCYRKQRTKPCLTGARMHIRSSPNFTKIAPGSDELYN
jgi:hypothetical protein